ncbi:MAG: hypothetical protein KF730_07350 [Sphingomonas sp.]|uniref:DUF6538 domain-containing protein n=1 Tax=Sphingomonas sp. TaxID=28214 RepID=UPI0025EC4168|nr:DUF6538 domain-containing protein [Sphingomonas sp.]MBX3564377.1 hypothetical protein [Sphingomonas sp.]
MSHSVKRAKSKIEQFRMTVPVDLRAAVGKREWTRSLHTTDRDTADAARGRLINHYKSEILRLRGQLARQSLDQAAGLVDTALERLGNIRGSMDAAIAQQLTLLASHVCDSWAPPEVDRCQQYGDMIAYEPLVEVEPVPSIDTDAERDVFRLRAEIFEGRGIADGIVYRELATILLRRRVFRPIAFAVSYLRSIEPRLDLNDDETYDAIAERYLARLVEHPFESWPANIDKVVAPTIGPATAPLSHAQLPAASSPRGPNNDHAMTGLWSMRLSEALRYWIEQRRPGASAITEATRSVSRFVALFGDLVIADITRPQVIEFRNLVTDMPPQVELAKLERSGRTLRMVIDEAREKRRLWEEGGRQTPEPERLASGTVKKDVGAMSQILGKVQTDAFVGINVAEKIEIAGYSKTRAGQKKPHLPLPPGMIQTLFDSPLFTGCAGIGDVARTKPGIHLYQDELYWLFLFGAMSGPRLREIGQLRLDDVHHCDMRRTFGDEYEGSCTFVHITGTGIDQEVKNDGSDRYVVLHDRLIDLGFNDLVAHRRALGKETLFDLPGTSGASPTKLLSNRLNRYFDRTVTDDDRYVFHSMRHEFTDRAELSDIPARVAKRIKGHALTEVADRYGLVSIFAQWHNLKKLNVSFIDWDRLIAARDDAPAADRFAVRRLRSAKT